MNDLLPSIFSEILRLSHLLRRADDRGIDNPHLGIPAILGALQLAPKTVPQLARIRGTSRQNIQIIVNRLCEEGHLKRVRNPAHKRSDLLVLTESGEALRASLSEGQSRLIGSLRPQISADEARAALELLQRLREVLSGGNQMETAIERASVQK